MHYIALERWVFPRFGIWYVVRVLLLLLTRSDLERPLSTFFESIRGSHTY
jgi:hypothetical protein